MTEEMKSGGGAAKYCLIGCLVLFVLAIVGGFVAVQVMKSAARTLIAGTVELGFETVLEAAGVPQEDQDEVMTPIREFTQDLRDGNVSMEQGKAVGDEVTEIMDGVIAALQGRKFDKSFLQPSELSAEEKATGSILASRYGYGKAKGEITGHSLTGHLTTTEEVARTDGQPGTRTVTKMKQALTTEEVQAVLATMKTAVEEGGIPEGKQEVDLGAIIKTAIDTGMTKGSASGG